MNKLLELLKIEAKEISTSFDKASIEGAGTPQEVSDRREMVFKNFLAKYFPFPYKIVKGNIIDTYGSRSNSIDCIVINPSHPYTVDSNNLNASIIFADGVDYAIEIKPDLSSKIEIQRGLAQIQSIKKLKRVRTRMFNEGNCEKIPAIIFAEKTYVESTLLLDHIVDYYVKNKVPQNEQFDMIVINNRFILFNVGGDSYIRLKDYKGIVIAENNENTMALFLLYLNSLPRAEALVSESIIKLYLKDIKLNLKISQKHSDKLNAIKSNKRE